MYSEKQNFPDSVKKSQTVAINVLVSDYLNKLNADERNQNESDKMSYFCHIFKRFFRIYVVVLSGT
jgi:hypothetical protein